MKKILTLLLISFLIAGGAYFVMHKMHHGHEHGHSHEHGHMELPSYKLGDLTISQATAKATPNGAPVGAGYLIVKNNGSASDFLISGTVDFADHVEVHEMKMNDGVMQMRKLAEGLEIPAGGEVVLKPGGYHLMFMKLSEQLKAGEKRKAKLQFKNAGEVEIEFMVHDMKGGHDHSH